MELSEVRQKVHNASQANINLLEQISENSQRDNKIPKIVHFCFLDYENMSNKHLEYLKTWFEILDNEWVFVNWTPLLTPANSVYEQYVLEHNYFAHYSDYIRCHKVYQYGGVYFDCDVRLYRQFNELLDYNYVFDTEYERNFMECAAFMAKKENKFLKIASDAYDELNENDIGDDITKFLVGPFWMNALNRNGVSVGINSSSNLLDYKTKVNSGYDYQMYCLDSSFLSCPLRKSKWTKIQQEKHQETICSHMFEGTWTINK